MRCDDCGTFVDEVCSECDLCFECCDCDVEYDDGYGEIDEE